MAVCFLKGVVGARITFSNLCPPGENHLLPRCESLARLCSVGGGGGTKPCPLSVLPGDGDPAAPAAAAAVGGGCSAPWRASPLQPGVAATSLRPAAAASAREKMLRGPYLTGPMGQMLKKKIKKSSWQQLRGCVLVSFLVWIPRAARDGW